jgi:hypothetical protein
VAGFGGGMAKHGGTGGEKKGLTPGANMSVTGEEKRRLGGMRKARTENAFGECTMRQGGGL